MNTGANFLLWFLLLMQLPPAPGAAPERNNPLEKSPYFAFVDREYIFTIEIVKPGVPILNFVSMTNEEIRLHAKNIKLDLGNRKSTVKMLVIETADYKDPMIMASIPIHPRSSFGIRIEGDLDNAEELYGVTIRLGDEDFHLAPLSNVDFEKLVSKVNLLNLGSPDFREDWQVLKLELIGIRSPARKERSR